MSNHMQRLQSVKYAHKKSSPKAAFLFFAYLIIPDDADFLPTLDDA